MSYRYATIGELRLEARRARHRDLILGAGAAIGGYLIGKARQAAPGGPGGPRVRARVLPVLAVPVLATAEAIAAWWPWLLALALLLGLARLARRRRERRAPVPWDADYRPKADPVPGELERRYDQRDDDDGIPY